MKLEFIKEHARDYPLKDLCEALEVAPSAYHEWINREPSLRDREDMLLQRAIEQIHKDSKGRLGHRMIYRRHLKGRCGRDRVLRLMRCLDIVGAQPRSYLPRCTDSDHDFGYSPNRLKEAGPPR